ncbi:photosystem II biogenesis protein Psp29 [Prochlorococcus marinus]|uniref:photosystem II biogenesis protein Psp29 n=1 Tax=Prochlorococcus marinus TaxID=1219 RepID=UPI0022B3FFAA|nr:photosystem II biogenesis protein Psp29 [Prochlorococcus marinus]
MSVRATISDSKSDFHKEFPYVIPPIYRKLADELLVELHLLSHQKNFKKDSIFAIGLKEIFNKFTSGYKPSDHITKLFEAICNCNGFNPTEISSSSEELVRKAKSFTKEDLNSFLSQHNNDNKGYDYYSRINAIGIYKLVSEIPSLKDVKEEDINKEVNNVSELLGYQYSRVEKDISMYKSNIEKMKQALEIIALNVTSK